MNQWRTIVGAAACAAMAAGIGLGLTWPAHAQITTQNSAAGGLLPASTSANASPSTGAGQGGSGGASANNGGSGGGSRTGSSGNSGSTAWTSQSSNSTSTGTHATATPSGSASAMGSGGTKAYSTIHSPVRVAYEPPPPPQAPPAPCLMGYVWRQAVAGDYVCVTPATRAQAAADNAAAASRVNPQGGPWGPNTCYYGWVWRGVTSTDYVCVTPDTRAQVQADNAQAANRELLMRLWLSDWDPTPPPPCTGPVCSTGGNGGPLFQVNGENFNFGKVMLVVRSDSDNSIVWTAIVTAQTYTGFNGAALYAQSPLLDCTTDPYATPNDYLQAYDEVSGSWSARLPVNSDCLDY